MAIQALYFPRKIYLVVTDPSGFSPTSLLVFALDLFYKKTQMTMHYIAQAFLFDPAARTVGQNKYSYCLTLMCKSRGGSSNKKLV